MKAKYLTLSATSLAVALALSACGGGGGDSLASGGSTTVRGVITGFGSVFVDGVEYEVNGASVSVDGQEGSEADLEVGMVVTLEGAVNDDGVTGIATRIIFNDEMEGVVTANNVAADGTGSLTVMGKTVHIDAETVFESHLAGVTAPNLIQVGNVVEVSGHASSNGDVFASRIEVKSAAQAAGDEIEVKGVISNLTATTFNLGTLLVDYSGVSGVSLADGQYVEVKSITPFDGSGALAASKIELENDSYHSHEGEEGDDLKVEGLVTGALADGRFELSGRTVLIDDGTVFEHGASDQLKTGVKIEVEAHYNAAGELVADKIEFGHESEAEFKGQVEAVDPAAQTVTIMGQVIHVDNATIKVDDSDDDVRYFNLADIKAGDCLEVKVYADSATGALVAVKLERENGSSEHELKGTVTVTTAGIEVNGVPVDVSGAGMTPSFSGGDKVEVKGSYSSGVLYATEVELED